MRKDTKTIITRDPQSGSRLRLDELDFKIIRLLVSGLDNKHISKQLRIPLSTVQRRTRTIFARDIVKSKIEPNYKKLGYNKGTLHILAKSTDVTLIAQKLAQIDGVTSVAVHLGSLDIIAESVYRTSSDVLAIISQIWNIAGIDRVTWSEEIRVVPVRKAVSLQF